MDRTFRLFVALAVLAGLILSLALPVSASATGLTLKQKLGGKILFDKRLSEPRGQACAACHAASVGWTGPDSEINLTRGVYEGANPGHFGNRKPPTAAYAGYSPIFNYDTANATFVGGMFWDGRATGFTLGDPLAEQAEGPFLNPLEHNNPDAAAVVAKVKSGPYAQLFRLVWGRTAFTDTNKAYEYIARSIAAYERSRAVSAFTSKYDLYLRGKVSLTAQQRLGLEIFETKGDCASCHPNRSVSGRPALFTDYTYDNLGVPKNPMNPFYMELDVNPAGASWVDPGLGGFLESTKGSDHDYSSYATANMGKFKVPTLRNVDKRPYRAFVKCYGHNGYFKSLKEIVHFYNTRDTLPWPAPEHSGNMNNTIGNLGLSQSEEDALVAFMKTLSDGYRGPRRR